MAESIRFFFDQHIFGAVVNGLRQRGVDVLTAQEAGRCGVPDPEQLAFATEDERVMVSFDVDFIALHQAGVEHSGIAWCRATKYKIGELIQMLLLLHAVTDRDAMRNQLERL